MKHCTRKLLIAALASVFCYTAAAQVPQIINYQGRINVSSSPFTGAGQFRFALVNGDASTSFWSNDGTSTAGSEPTAAVSLPVANGLYVVPLGDTTFPNMQAIPVSVFANNDVHLRVWFSDGTNGSQLLTPDQRITSVGYAMVAGTVPDGAVGITQLAPAARPKHDRQMVANTSSSLSINPTGGSFVDMPGLTLTAKNLGESGTYILTFKTIISANPNWHDLIINRNGVDVAASLVTIYSSGSYQEVSTTALVSGVTSGDTIKIRCRVSGSTANFIRPVLVIDGVPSSQVIP